MSKVSADIIESTKLDRASRHVYDIWELLKKAQLKSKWLSDSTRILISAWTGLAISPTILFVYRVLEQSGAVTDNVVRIIPTNDRLVTTVTIRPGSGLLLSCFFLSDTATVRRGDCYVNAALTNSKDAVTIDMLCEGYVTSQCGIEWPDFINENSVAGFGSLKTITGANPAAGAEVSDTVPANARWKLRAIKVTFVASAAVANRVINITFDDGTTVFLTLQDRTAITAGQTRAANANTFSVLPADTATDHYFVLPFDLWLSQGYRIKTVTTLLDVADDYGAPTYIVEEFLEE